MYVYLFIIIMHSKEPTSWVLCHKQQQKIKLFHWWSEINLVYILFPLRMYEVVTYNH